MYYVNAICQAEKALRPFSSGNLASEVGLPCAVRGKETSSLSPRSQHLLVLIPAYNERAAIRQVVSSVRASVPDADVLVVDDGSCDDTLREA